jgi:hypothetical protein
VNTLEILPPLGRPKSKIVEVEMPYSTKLLTQEQETYLNLTMRYITTSGVTRLNPLEFSGTSSEVVKDLPRLILPETVAPAYIEEVPKAVLTVEQLRSMGATVTALSEEQQQVVDTVLEESQEGVLLEQDQQMAAMANLQQNAALGVGDVPVQGVGMAQPLPMNTGVPAAPVNEMMGGMPPPALENTISGEGIVPGPTTPGGGPVIAVRTDSEAMMMDGIMPGGFGMGRQVRRNPFRGGMNMGPMMPMTSRYTPMDGGGSGGMPSSAPSGPITITKLE